MRKKTDKIFLLTVIILAIFGFLIFLSSSMGGVAKEATGLSRSVLSQFVLGLVAGGLLCFFVSWKLNLTWVKKYAFILFVLSFILTALVFVPGLGKTVNGARRWLSLGGQTIQPSEFLKVGYIIFSAAYFAGLKEKINNWRYGLLPFLAILLLTLSLFALQPDMDGAMITALCGGIIFFVAGAKWRDILIISLCGIIAAGVLIVWKPYIKDRLYNYIYPAENSLGIGYQLQQSLIAIGSGGLTGKGFGQSVQKFKFLPETTSDSIFAIAGEEFGFVGATTIIALFLVLMVRGLRIALKSPDKFNGLLVIGLVILLVSQSLVNIASMIGVFPLSGLPLIFFSKGGTSLLVAFLAVGLILNASKSARGQRIIKTQSINSI